MHKARVVTILIVFVLGACCSKKEKETAYKTTADTLSEHLRLDTADIPLRTNLWYSGHLIQMNEPNLKQAFSDSTCEAYRLLVLPTFGQPYCIKVVIDKKVKEHPFLTRSADTFCLVGVTYTVTYGAGGYGGGPVESSLYTNLLADDSSTAKNLIELHAALNDYGFWSEKTEHNGIEMTDGTMVILEAVKNGRYHLVCRHIDHVRYTTNMEKYYPKEYKYKELIQLCLAMEEFSDLDGNAYRKNIQDRQITRMKKMKLFPEK